jgi:hypothetical protein
VSQTGVAPPQFALEVQPARHVCVCESQMGLLFGQFVFVRHCTQLSVVWSQIGVFVGQLVSLRHCTQPPRVVSLCGAVCGHWVSLVHAAVH